VVGLRRCRAELERAAQRIFGDLVALIDVLAAT
jgi:hypothetical protein